MSDEVRTPKQVYAEAIAIVEQALGDAARLQWNGQKPDLHRERRTLIELRRTVPNDRLDPCAQVVRDLLTTYATLLDEQTARDTYERERAVSTELKLELERLRPRAARQGLPVLADDLRGFKLGRAHGASAPARQAAPPAAAPDRTAADPARPKRRRHRSRRGSSTPTSQ